MKSGYGQDPSLATCIGIKVGINGAVNMRVMSLQIAATKAIRSFISYRSRRSSRTPITMAQLGYRPDIDGLRAIAVLLVLMFHLGLGVPGGYIGVDVFFVISGFLITGIIKREIEQGKFTFAGFYARRARRILPALLAVLMFSSIAALFILLPSELERYAKSVVATLLSVSNFWFWSQGGYFGAASEMAPLLHTWTLAVEEQFYVLLPIALVLLYR